MDLLFYISDIGKINFLPLSFNAGVYSFPPIKEKHIIGGIFIGGQKAFIDLDDLTEIENYAQNNNVWMSFVEPHMYMPEGRAFDIPEVSITFKQVEQ